MEQNFTMFEFNRFSFCLYDDYFVYKTKKKDYLLSYSEIKTIEKHIVSVNYVTSVEFKIVFLPIENFPARFPIEISFRPSNKKELSLFHTLTELLLEQKSICFENGQNQYPEKVKKDRELNIARRPLGTKTWGKLRCYHTDLWILLMAMPLFNIVPIIWYNICRKYIFY